MAKPNRRQEILQAFAAMLEEAPGSRITTAAIARQVGVSEAALYRHFPSKAKMLEALIEFVEASLFPRIHRIAEQTPGADQQCRQILTLLLTFAERNPGFMRLLSGDALQGETARLRTRVRELFDRPGNRNPPSPAQRRTSRTPHPPPTPPTCCWPTPKAASPNSSAPTSRRSPPDTSINTGLHCKRRCSIRPLKLEGPDTQHHRARHRRGCRQHRGQSGVARL